MQLRPLGGAPARNPYLILQQSNFELVLQPVGRQGTHRHPCHTQRNHYGSDTALAVCWTVRTAQRACSSGEQLDLRDMWYASSQSIRPRLIIELMVAGLHQHKDLRQGRQLGARDRQP